MNQHEQMLLNNIAKIFDSMTPDNTLSDAQQDELLHRLAPVLLHMPLRGQALDMASHIQHATVEDYIRDADELIKYLIGGSDSDNTSRETDNLAL